MLTFIVAGLLGLASQQNTHPTFYISPRGDDAWAGNVSKPFKTLERARDAVRSYRRSHKDEHANITVSLEKGLYELDQSFLLTPEDSDSSSELLKADQGWTMYRGNAATISGGRRIQGLVKDEHGWWTTTIPMVRDGKWRFSQLFVNGSRRYRPRLPKQGYFNIANETPPSAGAKGHGFDRFQFRPGDIKSDWHNLSDVELLCFHVWDMSRMRIGSVDPSSSVVTTTGPTGYDADWAKFPKGNRFLVENVREALGEAGEWYIDNKSGEFTYIPMPGEKLENSMAVAPVIERLVDIRGDATTKKRVQRIKFQGIAFADTNWNLPPQGRFFPQAEVDLGAAIHANWCKDIYFRDCQISHVGEYGVEFGAGCHGVGLSDCTLSDLGAGGVKIGETRLYDDPSDAAQGVDVSDNKIMHGGRLHPAAIGVWVGQSSQDHIAENDIFDFYYTGISLGWTWGYGKSQAHDIQVLDNHIYDIGQGVLSDMGGIYTLGIQPGTVLSGNRIHDVDSYSYGGWGIYPDEGSSHELIENNVVFRTKSGAFHQHYGQENVVRNNIFAFAREAEIIRTRAEDHLSFTFENNIVYWKDAPLLGSNWSGNNYKLDNNVYWRTDGKPVDFAGMTLDMWHAKGQDLHSLVADPLFVEPGKDDFRLRPNSPAFKLGFKTWPQSKVGAKGRLKRDTSPKQPPAFPVSQALNR